MPLFSLVKKGSVHYSSKSKVIPAEVYSKLLHIDELLEEVHEEIKQLKEENALHCEELRKQASEQGFKQGLVNFNTQILHLDHVIKDSKLEMQKMILPLALQAAKKIVGQQLQVNPETIVDIVLQAIKPITQSYQVKIFVSKQDKELLESRKPEIKKILDHVKVLSVQEREDVSPGGCLIETDSGIINASIENQWRALETAFESYAKR